MSQEDFVRVGFINLDFTQNPAFEPFDIFLAVFVVNINFQHQIISWKEVVLIQFHLDFHFSFAGQHFIDFYRVFHDHFLLLWQILGICNYRKLSCGLQLIHKQTRLFRLGIHIVFCSFDPRDKFILCFKHVDL